MVTVDDMGIVYKLARANKRSSGDAVDFEVHWELGVKCLVDKINSREYRCDRNYTFISPKPKPREVFGCEMETRLVQWYVIWRLMPAIERKLTKRSFNNRVGMGTDAAIERVRQDFIEVSHGYTTEAYYLQWDIEGYFPNAKCDIACEQLQRLVREDYKGEDKDDLLWMIMISIHANPQRHCYRKSPLSMWELIDFGKSLFEKEAGTGGAIGFFIWQIGMNLYLDDVDHWIIDELGLRLVRYVDDNVLTVENKEMALALLPQIRERYVLYGVKMHPRKFNCQSVYKGIHFLGSYIRYERVYVHKRTLTNALKRVQEYNRCEQKERSLISFLGSVNSTLGLLKSGGKSEYRNIKRLVEAVDYMWYDYVYFDEVNLSFKPLYKYRHESVIRKQFDNIANYKRNGVYKRWSLV